MIHSVGIGELRQQVSAVLKRVVTGELEGRATEAVGDLLDSAAAIGLPAAAGGPVLPSGALAELRADER
jgi:hypothetical protein